MSTFISQLESRVLFSVSAFQADKITIVAEAAVVKADLKVLIASNRAETATIAKDFKGIPKIDALLLKTLQVNQTRGEAALAKEVNVLASTGIAISGKAATIGQSLLKKATVRSIAAATLDVASLGTVTTVPLASIEAQVADQTLSNDRAAIIAAFPTNTVLDADVMTEETNATAEKAAIVTAATQFQSDIAILASDLSALISEAGTFPNLMGTLTGFANATSGPHAGATAAETMVIDLESEGQLTGTLSDPETGGNDPLTGMVSFNGAFTAKAVGGGGGIIKLIGQVSGATVNGTFKAPNIGGTFSLTLAG